MTQKPDNGLWNILFNVILPVFILNQLTAKLGALGTLLLALSFPIFYGLRDLLKSHRINGFSLLGILNVMITGGFAIIGLDGIWFSVKEAAFPFLIGIFVWISSYTQRPFMKTLFLNPHMVDVDLIDKKLEESRQHDDFEKHLRQSTRLLSISFFISAALNFFLANKIFTPIDATLSVEVKAELINSQIAKMTSLSFGVIVVPSMILMFLIIWLLLRGIKQTTGLDMNQIMKN